MRKELIEKSKRIVVKVGSSVIVGETSATVEVRDDIFKRLAVDLYEIRKAGKEVVLVTSGAIAMGLTKLSQSKLFMTEGKIKNLTIPQKQALASIGQSILMSSYAEAFKRFKVTTSQVLLTHSDLGDRQRFINARNTITTLFDMDVLPIINENDTVSVDELKFGDNDNLAAQVVNLIEADTLIMLTDTDGIFDKNPKVHSGAVLLEEVTDIDKLHVDMSVISLAGHGDSTSVYGSGGITSKVESAGKAAHFGCSVIIANGTMPGILKKIVYGQEEGTFVFPKEDQLTSKKHWIAYSTKPSGKVFLDEGCISALKEGKSLLPSGVKTVEGVFDSGDVIHCVDGAGAELARGVTNYSSAELMRIKGAKSSDIESILGFKVYDEAIHRDNLVVF